MRRGGTSIAFASAVCDRDIGFRNSSIRISPGWGFARVLRRGRGIGATYSVMAGLVPAIHVLLGDGQERKTWMPGTRPGMTECGCRSVQEPAQISVSYRSSQFGFIAWINRTFQARGQCLMFFSRWIAN